MEELLLLAFAASITLEDWKSSASAKKKKL